MTYSIKNIIENMSHSPFEKDILIACVFGKKELQSGYFINLKSLIDKRASSKKNDGALLSKEKVKILFSANKLSEKNKTFFILIREKIMYDINHEANRDIFSLYKFCPQKCNFEKILFNDEYSYKRINQIISSMYSIVGIEKPNNIRLRK